MFREDRSLGAFATPKDIVNFMVELANPASRHLKVLEVACGDGPFLRKFAEKFGYDYEFVGVEISKDVARNAQLKLPFAKVINDDYLLWNPSEKFDIIIGNPPYGIIGSESHYPIHVLKGKKDIYKKKFTTWYGKYNIYGAFIEHSVNLLKEGGKLIFIVPASWLVLNDFIKLRLFLSVKGELNIYYLGKVFPKRNVSCVVIVFKKGKKGLKLYEGERLALEKPDWSGEIVRFESDLWLYFEKEGVSLEQLFKIHFAARSTEIKSHPNVSFAPKHGYLPVLTGRNLKPKKIIYDDCYSGVWFPKEEVSKLRYYYSFPHIVVGHTKGVRVVAAVDEKCYPWREEFHLVPKVSNINIYKITDYLNSDLLQEYVSFLYRDFVPHLTLAMLKRIPIPYSLLRDTEILAPIIIKSGR